MPPRRDPRRDQAAEIFREHNGKIDLVEIARQLDIPEGTVRGWKSKDKEAWSIGTERSERSNQSERSEKKTVRSKPTPKAQAPPLPTVDEKIIAAVEENEELNDKQKLFCAIYSKIFNATQAYLKAYGCSYEAAMSGGSDHLRNPKIRDEVKRLKRIKAEAIMVSEEDVLELHVRTAFAAMDFFIKWGVEKTPYLHEGRPVVVEDPNDLHEDDKPKKKVLQHDSNVVWFHNSDEVDGQLVTEVKTTRDGASIKLRSADASMRFLENYFTMNPMNKYRMEYEARKLEVELMKLQASLPPTNDETGSSESNFNDALKPVAGDGEVWDDDDS